MGVFQYFIAGISTQSNEVNLEELNYRIHHKSHYDYPVSNRRTLLYYVNDNNDLQYLMV